MFVLPPSEWIGHLSVACHLLSVIYGRSVIIMSICALRMYRGLVDSAALNGPLEGAVNATEPSTVRNSRPGRRKVDRGNTGSTVPDQCPDTSRERVLCIERQDGKAFGSETA